MMRGSSPGGEYPMLYRALIGFVPMILIALFATGAIPLGSVFPTSEYRSSAVRAAAGEKGGQARTAEGRVSQSLGVLSSDQIRMMENNMEAVGDMERAAKEYEEERRQEARTPGWKPKSGGWGR